MARLRDAVVAALMVVGGCLVLPVGEASASSFYLDQTFGVDGVSQLTPSLVDVPSSVGIVDSVSMPDGRIVMAGVASTIPCQSGAWWVGRYLADGTIDTTFGTGTGWVAVTPSGLSGCTAGPFAPLQLRSVAVQSTGKIILAGGPNLVMMRLNVNGTVDTAFSPTRRQLQGTNWPFQCLPDGDRTGGRIWDLYVAPDDSIYAAGSLARTIQPPSQPCPGGVVRQGPAVLRYAADGTGLTELAAPWGTSAAERAAERLAVLSDGTPVVVTNTALHWLGSVQTSIAGAATIDGQNAEPIGLAVDSEDRVSLAVTAGDFRLQLAVRRYDATAAPDATFAAGGELRDDTLGRLVAMVLDGDDRVLLGGSPDEERDDLRLVRLDASGTLDPTFGTGGVVQHRPARSVIPANLFLRRLSVGSDGRIDVLATEQDGLMFGRLSDDGSPDQTYGVAGFAWATSPVTRRIEERSQVGVVEVAGTGETMAILGTDIVRWRVDGTVDDGFGTSGRLRAPLGTRFTKLVSASAGRIVVVGTNGADGTESESSFIARYDAATGTPDPSFGAGGFVGLADRRVYSVAIDSTGRVLAGIESVHDDRPSAVVRFSAAGEPDPTFGTSGEAARDLVPYQLAVDADDRLLVGGVQRFVGTPMLVRLTTDGAADPTWTTTTLTDYVYRLHPTPDGGLLVRHSGLALATRVLPDGGIDTDYGDGGTISHDPNTYPVAASVDAFGRLLLTKVVVSSDDVIVSRYTAGGDPDPAFGTAGSARTRVALPGNLDFSVQTGGGAGTDLDASGRLVLAIHASPFGSNNPAGQLVTLIRLPADPPSDSTPPVVSLLSPVDGGIYRSDVAAFADFSCSDADTGLDSCVGTRQDGQSLDPTLGANTFTVTATDLAGLTTAVTAHYDVLDALSTTLSAGGTTGTGTATSPNDLLETQVTTPNAGAVSILEQPVTTPVAGYRLIDWESVVTAPPATAAVPLRLTFLLDATVLGALDATTVQVLRNGTVVAECAPPPNGTATPDPCVTERTVLAGGGALIGVLTSAASTWTFGELADATPPTITLDQPANGSSFTRGQAVTATYSCADAESGIATCVGPVPNGTVLDTSTAGTFPFVVTATDGAGNAAQLAGSYQVLAGSVSSTVTGPAIVDTDPGGLGASSDIPVQTRLSVPAGVSGTYALTARTAGTSPTGSVLFGTAVDTSGPAAPSPAAPHGLVFTIDSTQVGPVTASQVTVFRGTTPVPACTGSGATPDPCVAGRSTGPAGDVTITVRSTQLGSWSFGRPKFVVFGATPAARAQGTSAQTVVIAGDGFAPTASAKFSGTGVSVSAITRSPTSLQLTIAVSGTAAVGPRDVIITNPGQIVASCAGCFTVSPRPTVTAASPPSRPRGASHATLQISGTGFQPGAAAAFSGTGVTVHGASFVDPTRIDLDVTIDAAAATGARALTVTNPDGGTGTKSGALTVNALPTITSAAPSLLRRGQTLNVAINGSGISADFVTGGGTVTFGEGVSVQTIVRNSVNKLTATVTVDPAAAPGSRDVTVTNPDGGAASCSGCATLVADPQIATIAPASWARGSANQTVTVSGTGFQSGAVVKVLGSGVTVASTTVVDPTTMTVVLSVGGSAPLGARDVTVTNPDTGTSTCSGCFIVNARPTIGTLAPNAGARGSTGLAVQLNGTGLQPGMTVVVSGSDVVATVINVTPTAATLSVDVAPNAATGQRSVTVTNPDTGAVSKANAFRVT